MTPRELTPIQRSTLLRAEKRGRTGDYLQTRTRSRYSGVVSVGTLRALARRGLVTLFTDPDGSVYGAAITDAGRAECERSKS